ncbi:MAG: hypothetical protein PWR06_847 [Thermoanaerobacteraceae bacterium]|nr:hypothetical protein [Thermoanaerobacteraceae bacterium]
MPKTVLNIDIERLDDIVESNSEYKERYEEFHRVIEQFKSDRKLYDSIDASVFGVEAVTRKIAFEAGFAEGVRHINGIMSGKEALSHK